MLMECLHSVFVAEWLDILVFSCIHFHLYHLLCGSLQLSFSTRGSLDAAAY